MNDSRKIDMEKLTIKRIAELSGFSTATVSRVINNKGRYSENTRKKIMKIIEEYDYRPDGVAKSLRTRRSKTIGIVVPDITNEFYAQLVLAIENYCEPKGYSVFICNSGENEEKELRYYNELEIKGVDGLVYLSGSNKIPRNTLPVVSIDRKPKNSEVVTITSDNFNGGYLAATELIEKGCQKLLLIRDIRDTMPVQDRMMGFLKALNENSLSFDERNVLKVEVSMEESYFAVKSLLKKGKFPFDGIFATTDGLALGAMTALEESGYYIPKDVRIVGFDNISLANFASLTTIHQDKRELGHRAAEILISMIEYGIKPQQDIIIPVKLVRRKSTTID